MSLHDADSYDLLLFARAYADLGNAVQEQVNDVVSCDCTRWKEVNTNAVKLIKDKLYGWNEEVDDAIDEFYEWLDGTHCENCGRKIDDDLELCGCCQDELLDYDNH